MVTLDLLLQIPRVFALVAQIQNARRRRYLWVTSRADLVIEGFPRSASTFLYRIIRSGGDNRLTIGHHVHRPQQIRYAVRYNVPCLVLVREPLGAIASQLVRQGHSRVDSVLAKYIHFNRTVLDYADNPMVRIILFDDITSQPARFGNAALELINLPSKVDEALLCSATVDNRSDMNRSSIPNAHKEYEKAKLYLSIKSALRYHSATELFKEIKRYRWQP